MCEVKFKKPCNDCPFRRDSIPGWCGDSEPEWFVESALADYTQYQDGSYLAPCHQTVDYNDPDWESKLGDAAACAGALIFAKNRCKSPRDPNRNAAVRSVDTDYETVFASPDEFIEHHRGPNSIRSWEKR